jgi:Ca-activated chloride channel family protein
MRCQQPEEAQVFNPRTFENSRPDGFPVLEIVADGTSRPRDPEPPVHEALLPERPRLFVPLRRTDLRGDVVGPVALLRLSQQYQFTSAQSPKPIEAVYRFPLPGDAAVTGVRVRFGEVEIRATLAERQAAEQEYQAARDEGRQAALLTREAPDVFTLQVAGLKPDEAVTIETSYAQLARAEADGWSLRVPLTTVPRYVRGDERGATPAQGQPLAVLRDPGHRFALDIEVEGADDVASPTHPLDLSESGDGRQRVRLQAGDVIPDRDFVLTWRARRQSDRPLLTVLQHDEPDHPSRCFLALVAPPSGPAATETLAREVILLIDHSGSMSGPKWQAADWAVQNLLAGLSPADTFNLGLFHDSTRWFSKQPVRGDERTLTQARDFLLAHQDSGGTELGVALEQSLGQKRDADARARHVLIVTDAQVSDAGRILALVEREATRADRRRVDVLCIDAAPNSGLANELAERGGGLARFLTSDPAENDIASALDEVLADWAAPVERNLTLWIDGAGVQAAGRRVTRGGPGAGSGPGSVVLPARSGGPATSPDSEGAAIDLGDLSAGRAVWVAGRVRRAASADQGAGGKSGAGVDGQAWFRLLSDGREIAAVPADPEAGRTSHPAIAALFGARRVLDLELAQSSGLDPDVRLRQLGYDPSDLTDGAASDADAPIYAENARAQATDALHDLLVKESLRYGIACSATAFVATRREAGQRVAGTVPVASALAEGWSGGFVSAGSGMMMARMAMPSMAPGMMPPMAAPMPFAGSPPPAPGSAAGGGVSLGDLASAPLDAARGLARRLRRGLPGGGGSGAGPRGFAQSDGGGVTPTGAGYGGGSVREEAGRPGTSGLAVLFSGTPTAANGEAVLFDSGVDGARLPSGGTLSRLAVRFLDGAPPSTVDAGLTLALYVDDLTAPRARVRLADLLRQGGERPLNVRRQPGQVVRLVLLDPSGAWASGGPALEVSLG